MFGYAGQPVAIRSWDDAAAYVERTNRVAFPDYTKMDWHALARRTFKEENGVPVLAYDTAISVAMSRPPSRWAPWLAQYLFRRLVRRRPVLLLRGALSDIISADIADRMQRNAPALQRVDIAGVGHAPSLTEPQAVDAIRNFLRTVP
jgi:pimeloyl-ACP methyl ester carboxylesterase